MRSSKIVERQYRMDGAHAYHSRMDHRSIHSRWARQTEQRAFTWLRTITIPRSSDVLLSKSSSVAQWPPAAAACSGVHPCLSCTSTAGGNCASCTSDAPLSKCRRHKPHQPTGAFVAAWSATEPWWDAPPAQIRRCLWIGPELHQRRCCALLRLFGCN